MAGSNRFALVDREHLHGTIRGVDFGHNLYCIARSPGALLLWSAGTMYVSGRENRYGRSELLAIKRTEDHSWARNYKMLGDHGGRLAVARIKAAAVAIAELFEDDSLVGEIERAVREHKTLLIEGGGEAFPLSRRAILAQRFSVDV